MVAPKGPGHVVRSQYKEGKGVPALIAVLKGSSKDSKAIALGWAAGRLEPQKQVFLKQLLKKKLKPIFLANKQFYVEVHPLLLKPVSKPWWKLGMPQKWPI